MISFAVTTPGEALATTLGQAPASPGPDDVEPTIEALLEAEELDEDPEVLAEQRAEYALQNLLRHDFAQTRSVHARIEDLFDEPAVMLDAPTWLDTMERRAAVAALRGSRSHAGAEVSRLAFDIPLADHPLVDTYIEHFTGRGRWYFAKWLSRAGRYLPIMRPILKEKGLPEDLVYVAMIESGLSSRAVSTAAACGYWQFIGSTGKLFKLKINFWVDERRDFVRSTEAAAAYLTELHQQFGDWHLAWAGYNAGGGRVSRALKRHASSDYWGLVDRKGGLSKETRHYVPKVIAAAIIAKNREKYGFTGIEPMPPLLWDTVQIDDAVHLRVVARKLGVPMATLRELNPSLLQDVTPPGRHWSLRVPKGSGKEVAAWLDSLPKNQRLTYHRHTIRRGDTLWRIAERYGSTITAVREFNGIRNPRALRPGQSLIIPTLRTRVAARTGRKDKAPVAQESSKTKPSRRVAAKSPGSNPRPRASEAKSRSKRPTGSHTVTAGETLWSIAQRYGVSVDRLKSWNNRRSNVIIVGETLKLF
jgi:membrane-bound lytic murein transglycosylase D